MVVRVAWTGWRGAGFLALALVGCDVPAADPGTGGVDLDTLAVATPAGCARGVVVVNTDYLATNVSLVGLDGWVLSSSFISSGSASPGLTAALGGDVALPTSRASGDRVLLIDRYPASVLTWVDLDSARVSAQLSVATGFSANPHDYAERSPTRAYVPRFDRNPAPGQEPFDAGADVLVIDPTVPEIVGRIDLGPALDGVATRFQPRPERAVILGDRLLVSVSAFTADLLESTDSRLVAIDTDRDAIEDVLVLDGLQGCAGMDVAPGGDELVVSCTGNWGGSSSADARSSGLVRVATGAGMQEVARYPAIDVGVGPLAFGVQYADATRLVFVAFGGFETSTMPARQDTLVELDLGSGEVRAVLHSQRRPFTLGDVSCDVDCRVCLVADAERDGGVVHRFEVTSEGLVHVQTIEVDPTIGLPPRGLGQF